jgi:PTS system nitrogen regulatory IIA component
MQLSVREVAQMLKVSENTVYRWVSRRGLPSQRLNQQYRFNRSEVIDWATTQRIELDRSAIPVAGGGGAGVAASLERGGIFYGVPGRDKPEVLGAVVSRMPLPSNVSPEMLLRVLLAREALASTGIGEGMAVPHARNPIVLHVERPMVTLCFLERPIDFDSIDGLPVDTLFVLVTPSVRGHLDLLSRLAYALRDPGFRAALERRASREEILAEARRVEQSSPRAGAAP